MSPSLSRVEPFDPRRHAAGEFECGADSLDRWLQLYAAQSQRRDAARSFVTADEQGAVAGYYTLVAGEVSHDSATSEARRGLSRHFPIPVAILVANYILTSWLTDV